MITYRNRTSPCSFRRSGLIRLLGANLVFSLFFFSCATAPKLPPPPPRYVYPQSKQENAKQAPASNSLWHDTASLYEDVKARRLNDLITINVVENISGSGTADTSATRKSSADAAVTGILGIPLNLNRPNLWGSGNGFSPTVGGSLQNDFAGSGATTRAGTLVGTITAKVVEVMPNGVLAIESRKDITINNERQILILRGMVRPDDIATDNSVLSSRVADAEVYFVGDGVVQSKQDPGWLAKILDTIWPF
ncbi:MAG TPA: flagellar basal body L-ring protein FlgH [Nitrospirota bacterium]|nr:flagellar basal body L-ring protein FlgH [Nitrospirota bacterium]